MSLKEAIQNKLNSAILTFENHHNDNSFLYSEAVEMEEALKDKKCEPVGVCFNVPFNNYGTSQVGFVYECHEEKYWCHMPTLIWETLLMDYFGRKGIDEIIDRVRAGE